MFASAQNLGVSFGRAYTPTRSIRRPIALVGELTGGRYRAQEILREGGMGIVVAARHVELGHRVAVKFLRAEARRSEEAIRRFRWEARASLGIRSEHVVRVTDAGTLSNGVPYLVMELLDGMNLGELMKRRGPHEVLTGSLIHEADSVGAMLARVCYCPVPSLRSRRPDLPRGAGSGHPALSRQRSGSADSGRSRAGEGAAAFRRREFAARAKGPVIEGYGWRSKCAPRPPSECSPIRCQRSAKMPNAAIATAMNTPVAIKSKPS
jgi:hypothetical protein